MLFRSISANGTNSEAYQIDGRTVSIDNNYLQATDYSYESGFYMGENKLKFLMQPQMRPY